MASLDLQLFNLAALLQDAVGWLADGVAVHHDVVWGRGSEMSRALPDLLQIAQTSLVHLRTVLAKNTQTVSGTSVLGRTVVHHVVSERRFGRLAVRLATHPDVPDLHHQQFSDVPTPLDVYGQPLLGPSVPVHAELVFQKERFGAQVELIQIAAIRRSHRVQWPATVPSAACGSKGHGLHATRAAVKVYSRVV